MLTRHNKYVWIDCEMTGLNPEKDTILEIAVVITDNHLELIDSGMELCIKDGVDKFLKYGEPFVVNMHNNSNLIRDIRKRGISLNEAKQKIFTYIKNRVDEREAPLCGSTIHMDRSFLINYMPNIINHLDYHVIDVASWRIIINQLRPYLIERKVGVKSNHRAMSDIIYSIMELKGFLQMLNLL